MKAFGREARDLVKFLSLTSDPEIRGLSGNRSAVIEFLKSLGIDMMHGENYRRWCDLTYGEKKEIIRGLQTIIAQNGGSEKDVESLLGEVYIINGEEIGSNLHDGKEFATLLNSCGKYGKANIGFEVCRGDRGKYYKEAIGFLKGHRANLVGAMRMLQDRPVKETGSLQYFHAGDDISEEVVGTVAGMLLNSGSVRKDLPIVAFVNTDDGKIKVSTRGTKKMVDHGLNLSKAVSEACREVGGAGGGHDRAAGGTIEKGKEEEFIEILSRIIKEQMDSHN
jgi:RecJ-like exonuclease